MQNIESLFDKAVGEIERMLNSKTVVGEPIKIEGNTLIPLVNVGFGFGVGSGEGTEQQKGTGHGGGTGGGGGVKPVALIVINDEGVHVESIKSGAASAFEKVAETVGKAAAARAAETKH
jgi:uncharacterized spore protein YtfJ